MDLFEIAFGAGSIEVTCFLKLLGNKFQNVSKNQVKEKDLDPKVTVIEKSTTSARTSIMDCLAASRQEEQPTPQENEIEGYLKAKPLFKGVDVDNKSTLLKWWKVKCH
jgi:hypothetical protein